MKKISTLVALISMITAAQGQILSSDPEFPTPNDLITVYYNVNSGNSEIPSGTIPIYAHTGLVSQTDEDNCVNNWQYVQGNWGTADPSVVMTPMGGGVHKIEIQPQTFYEYPGGLEIGRLMFVFRNQSGSFVGRNADGSDIYLELYDDSFHAGIQQPWQQVVIAEAGDVIPVHCASSEPAELTITVNGNVVASASNATELDYNFSELTDGGYNVLLTANNGTEEITENVLINIDPQPLILASPAGTKDGINYIDNESVRLQIYAPNKEFIYVIGDFNDWQFDANYLMNRTPDGNTYWLDITGLNPDQNYRFQYSIDAEDMRVADVYAETILDSWNDGYIPESTYPNLPEYPGCLTSQAVSVFKINQENFAWSDQAFVRPPQNRLVVYELLVRDFIENRNYQTLTDSLDYLANLGITAIELMPINEFEGNDSWGYNPSFYFAADKAYGDKHALKTFINECHNRGIAVIQDIALNHSFGQNPMVRMYFNPDAGEYGQTTAENPWFNEIPKHDFNVGYDFNHESPRVREFCKRVLEYWLEEYHIDGFRFDLSKGFTQNNTLGNIAAWSAQDNSRINILNDYHDHILSVEPGAYLILEHLADNSEETILSNNGMMLWGNLNNAYMQAGMGYSTDSNLSWGVYTNRGWASPNLVTYAESHDEERMMYKNLNFGNSNGGYNITQLNTALDRIELAHTFLIPIPGPKMIWQFGELGYDYSINYCTSTGTIDEDCRTYAKPVLWNYFEIIERYKVYQVVSALNNLKKTEALFSTTSFNTDLAGMGKRIHLNSTPLNCTVVGNFNVVNIDMVPGFQHAGAWYDYFSGNEINVSDVNASMNFQPGEYHLYFDQPMEGPDTTSINVDELMNVFNLDVFAYPNPATHQITVGFNQHSSQLARIELLDITGSVVEVFEEKNYGTGRQIRTFDLQDYPSGMYFIRITNGEQQRTQSLVIQR
jgi:1,4-alpha-glucan branching enzyme